MAVPDGQSDCLGSETLLGPSHRVGDWVWGVTARANGCYTVFYHMGGHIFHKSFGIVQVSPHLRGPW